MFKSTLSILFMLTFYCISFAQTRTYTDEAGNNYEIYFSAKDEIEPETTLVLLPGNMAPESWSGKVKYKNEDGDHVSKDGRYMFIYRENEEGELFMDSVTTKNVNID